MALWTLGGLPWRQPPFLGQFLLRATSQFLPPPRGTVGVLFLSFWFPCKLLPGFLIPMGTLVLVKLVWPHRLLATAQLQSLGWLSQDPGGQIPEPVPGSEDGRGDRQRTERAHWEKLR